MGNQVNHHIAENLRYLRNEKKWTQSELAEKLEVSRQTVAKWENGESLPDILNCDRLAEIFDVSLNDLIRHNPDKTGLPIGPKDKHIFGVAVIGEHGQIVLPEKACEMLDLEEGDTLVVLGDTNPMTKGLALIKSEGVLHFVSEIDNFL